MAFCSSCNRSFRSETSLDQHIKDSPAHAIKFYCGLCSIWLLDIDALEEHIRTSPPHSAPTRNTSKFKCDICSTTFVSQNFLNDHLQYSPLNATSFAHKLYSLVYLTRKELEENLQNLQAHTPNFECKSCTRLFNDQSALDRHLQSSSAHTPTFECDPCDRSFVSQDALDAHIQSSKAHAGERHGVPLQGYRSNPTPLDIFFAYYTSFKYDPTLPPSVSYAKLVDFYDWDRNDPEAEQHAGSIKIHWKMKSDSGLGRRAILLPGILFVGLLGLNHCLGLVMLLEWYVKIISLSSYLWGLTLWNGTWTGG